MPRRYRPDGKVNYLIDDFDIAYAPSAWILQRCVNRTRGRDLRMLAVGDPERSDSRPLPFAVWETDNISQMYSLSMPVRSISWVPTAQPNKYIGCYQVTR